MGTARQILRWAIPGWLHWLFVLQFILVRFLISGKVLTLTEFATRNFVSLLSLLTILAGLGIPIGFVLYQIYFWLYWSLALPIKTQQDRGYSILKDAGLDWTDLFGYDIDADAHRVRGKVLLKVGGFTLQVKTRALLKRYQHNWLLADHAWYLVLRQNGAEWLDERAIVLSDTYHAIGASLVSLWLGYVVYFLYDVLMHRSQIQQGEVAYLWAAGVNLVPLLLFTVILRFNRADTLRSLVALKHDLITALRHLPKEQRDSGPKEQGKKSPQHSLKETHRRNGSD